MKPLALAALILAVFAGTALAAETVLAEKKVPLAEITDKAKAEELIQKNINELIKTARTHPCAVKAEKSGKELMGKIAVDITENSVVLRLFADCEE